MIRGFQGPVRLVVAVAAAGVSLGVALIPAGATTTTGPTTYLVSREPGATGAPAKDGAEAPSISADGRYVAFESVTDLTDESTGGVVREVWVRDRVLNKTILVSRASGATGAPSNAYSDAPSISADGRFVAFESQEKAGQANNNLVKDFVPRETDTCPNSGTNSDIYLRDLQNNTTTLLTHAPGTPATAANGYSEDPVISGDGSAVAFDSVATDLDATDTARTRSCTSEQIFLHNVGTDLNLLISRKSGLTGAVADGASECKSVSDNAKLVAFCSGSSNLEGSPDIEAVYLRDLTNPATPTTTLVSRKDGTDGAAANKASGSPSISGDGSTVIFTSEGTNLITDVKGEQVYARKLSDSTTTLVSRQDGATGAAGDGDSGPAAVSTDGRFVAFETTAPVWAGAPATEGGTPLGQIMLRDRKEGTTTLVSVAKDTTDQRGNKDNQDVALSANHLVVAWESTSTNLTADTFPSDTRGEVFVRVTLAPAPTPTPTPAPTPPILAQTGGGGHDSGSGLLPLGLALGLMAAGAAYVGLRRRRRPQP